MKHTPGEWKVRIPEIEPERIIIESCWKEGDKKYSRSIARTFGYCDTIEEEQVNARLIAAAPRMLEALKAIAAEAPNPKSGYAIAVNDIVNQVLASLEENK